MQFACTTKEQAIFRHGVINAGTGENQAIIAAKAGDHNSGGH
jgi:hypothetical protein